MQGGSEWDLSAFSRSHNNEAIQEANLQNEDVHESLREEESLRVSAAISGDTAAFAQLYDRYLDRIYRHIYYRVTNQADAEDLTQQVFIQAWSAIGRYQQTNRPFLAWLFTIAHNTVVSFYRRSRNQTYLQADITAQHAPNLDDVLELHEREVNVRKAILRLKPEYQQVVMLRFVEEFSHAEVAAALGKSEAAVRVAQHRALQELRRFLKADETV